MGSEHQQSIPVPQLHLYSYESIYVSLEGGSTVLSKLESKGTKIVFNRSYFAPKLHLTFFIRRHSLQVYKLQSLISQKLLQLLYEQCIVRHRHWYLSAFLAKE